MASLPILTRFAWRCVRGSWRPTEGLSGYRQKEWRRRPSGMVTKGRKSCPTRLAESVHEGQRRAVVWLPA